VIASLEMAGVLEDLEENGIQIGSAERLGIEEGALLEASLRYLAQRGLVYEESGVFKLSALGKAVCSDKGYLVWLAGGYGETLRHLGAFLTGDEIYGTDQARDGRWVAGGAALLGRRDVAPQAMRLLESVSFDRVLDLGCGNARFLLSVCRAFGCSGVGVDISPEACEEAVKAVEAAGMAERVQIVRGDAIDLDGIPSLGETQLVITFFLLHEISSESRSALIGYLSDMSSRLPAGAHLLVAEVLPTRQQAATTERFTPEFDFVHAVMRQSLLGEDEWREALEEGGFLVREVVPLDMPGGVLILGRTRF
jgi:SAM-dependent methyltransferase